MKNLQDFQAEQIDLKSITGGIGGPATNPGPTYGTETEKPYAHDSTCCEKYYDTFYDNNNNGRWDSFPRGNEPGNETIKPVIICD